MQVDSKTDIAALIDQLVGEALPTGHGFAAWRAFLHAHAALMRRLATDLVQETGLTLGDFDVLAQLATENGELRMTELAAKAFSSRSNMTRRIDRLVEEGLVCRRFDEADGRGVVVALTERGLARFAGTAPVHLRGVAELFVAKLNDEELAVLERALRKLSLDTSFG
jgi:DNA-binding MarR family transcriptional regulator